MSVEGKLLRRLAVLSAFGCTFAWADDPPTSAPPQGQQMDCDALAKVPGSPISIDACRQMMGAMQQGSKGGPQGGARPGDESMTCEQIAAELKTMQGVGLSRAQQEENAAAASEHQAMMAKQQAQAAALGVEATAAVNAASAADRATELATGGVVRGKSAAAVGEAYQARAKAMGEEMAAERKPTQDRLMNAAGTSTEAMAKSMQENPRFSRLVQLAGAKNCRE